MLWFDHKICMWEELRLHKMEPVNIPTGRGVAQDPQPLVEELLAVDGC